MGRGAVSVGAISMCLAVLAGSAWGKEKVVIGVSKWIGYAPLYLAQEKGLFKEKGMDVEVKVIEALADRRAAYAAGRLQGIGTTVDAHVIAAAQGIPVRQVLALSECREGSGIVAKQSVKALADLKGKVLTGHKGGTTLFWVGYVLAQNGMSISDVQWTDLKPADAVSDFVAGKADAIAAWQPYLSKALDQGKGHLLVDMGKTPGAVVDTLALSPQFIKTHSEDVKKIVKAWYEALEFQKGHADEANVIMARFTGDKPEALAQYLKEVRFYGPQENKAYFGTGEKPGSLYQVVERAADLWYRMKEIRRKVTPKEVIEVSFVH
ncbi:MAG: ABC transporter substrate-binding protein [Thermodesulfobacteriota bacterium]